MAVYLISYDITEKDKDEYEPLWKALRQMDAVKILYSEWIVPGQVGDANRIYERLSPIIKAADRLLVCEITIECSWDRLLISDDEFMAIMKKNARS